MRKRWKGGMAGDRIHSEDRGATIPNNESLSCAVPLRCVRYCSLPSVVRQLHLLPSVHNARWHYHLPFIPYPSDGIALYMPSFSDRRHSHLSIVRSTFTHH